MYLKYKLCNVATHLKTALWVQLIGKCCGFFKVFKQTWPQHWHLWTRR